MSTFMSFALGVITGGILGSIGMFYLIKETNMDLNIDEDIIDLENPWEVEELEMPKEVNNGDYIQRN